MEQPILKKICRIVTAELQSYKESMTYYEIEVFVGSILAQLKAEGILTSWEESILRQKILGE